MGRAISVDTMSSVMVRARLMVASRWVWVLIALTALWIVLALLSSAGTAISLDNLYAAFTAATPALFAAALMYVAPQDRRIRMAAFGFALPIAVNLIIGAGILFAGRTLGSDYFYLAPRLSGLGDAFALVAWAFPIAAVFLVGTYIGPELTRGGWLIVGVAAGIALADAALIVASRPEGVPIDRNVIAVLAQSVWVAWAYLLAVAIERGMRLLPAAAGAYLASATVSLLSWKLVQSPADLSAPWAQALFGILWMLGVISWAAFIAGVVRELPGSEKDLPARRGTHQALSPTR